jgi:hypothetical protein
MISTIHESKLANSGEKDRKTRKCIAIESSSYDTQHPVKDAMGTQTGPSKQTIRGFQHTQTGKIAASHQDRQCRISAAHKTCNETDTFANSAIFNSIKVLD